MTFNEASFSVGGQDARWAFGKTLRVGSGNIFPNSSCNRAALKAISQGAFRCVLPFWLLSARRDPRSSEKVTVSEYWIDPTQCESLAVLVETVAGPMLIEHPAAICLEMDIDTEIPVPADPQHTCDLVRSLVGQSLREMTVDGDLTITAIETDRGLELEIADTGNDAADRSQSRPMAAAAIGAQLNWQDCPQGGSSVTVVFPPPQSNQQSIGKRRAA